MLINWSDGDEEILEHVVAGAEVCKCTFCASTTHTSNMCMDNQEDRDDSKHHRGLQRKDKYDCNVAYHEGKEICTDFNFNRCPVPYCRRAHVCANCMSTSHKKQNCPCLRLEKNISTSLLEDKTKKQKTSQ